jgi:hypothetical protein
VGAGHDEFDSVPKSNVDTVDAKATGGVVLDYAVQSNCDALAFVEGSGPVGNETNTGDFFSVTDGHNHLLCDSYGSFLSEPVVPPFTAIYFIMKIS